MGRITTRDEALAAIALDHTSGHRAVASYAAARLERLYTADDTNAGVIRGAASYFAELEAEIAEEQIGVDMLDRATAEALWLSFLDRIDASQWDHRFLNGDVFFFREA